MTEEKESVKEKLSKEEQSQVQILSIDEIFFSDMFDEIYRPDYQRPYRWQKKHVVALLNDLQNDMVKGKNNEFYLGTITVHIHDKRRDIVDGLQRLTTLYLILCALDNNLHTKEIPHFFDVKNDEGLANIQNNYKVIEKWLNTHSHDDMAKFIREQCFVAWNEVGSLDEAFQIFEGRNTKGKPLKPHDLLKAFHTRAFHSEEKTLTETLEKWESYSESDLHHIFETLYRIRAWSKGNYDAWEFTKDVRQEFQGLDPDDNHQTRILSFYCQLQENLKKAYLIEPVLFNGQYFFDWVTHQVDHFIWFETEKYTINTNSENCISNNKNTESQNTETILKFFNYSGANRKGDRYCQAVLKALLLLYRDRFLPPKSDGNAAVNNDLIHQVNYEKLFNFVYRKRIERNEKNKQERDKPVTVNKMLELIQSSRIFEKMSRAYTPEDFEKIQIDQVNWQDLKSYVSGEKTK